MNLIQAIGSRFRSIIAWLARKKAPPSFAIAAPASPGSVTIRIPKPEPLPTFDKKQYAKNAEDDGRWFHVGDLLNRLDDYFYYLGMMKRDDPDGFEIYRKIGGIILNKNAEYSPRLECGWRHDRPRPSFGMVAFLFSDVQEDDNIKLQLAYFRKYDKLMAVRQGTMPASGTIYQVQIYWAERKNQKHRHTDYYFVSVAKDGRVSALRERRTSYQVINGRRGRDWIAHNRWSYPWIVREWREHWNKRDKANYTTDYVASWFFGYLQNANEYASNDAIVRVERDGLAAMFSVAILNTPAFFKDRDFQATVNGARRKIFHIVRTHWRTLPSGERVPVRSHFRGARKFQWNGYDILISMPGYHHAVLNELDTGAVDAAELNDEAGWVTESQMADVVREHMTKQ